MEIAASDQSILTSVLNTHMQPLGPHQPLVPGGMLYPGRCSVWQPVPTNTTRGVVPVPIPVPLPVHSAAMTEVPKESIIANTDFTTTSLIAKRRLSSKKRRMQHLNGSTGSDISTESSTQSPASSANGSPAMASSSISTPMVTDKSDEDPFSHKDITAVTTAAEASPSTTYSGIPLGGSGHYMSMASSTHPVAMQVANPVLSQLQQGLNYRFLQEQSLLQQQQQQQGHAVVPTSTHVEHPQPVVDHIQRVSAQSKRSARADVGSGFKWCVAHVTIARQIQQHKQHQNGASSFHIHQDPVNFVPSSTSTASSQSPPTLPHPPHALSHTPPSFNSTSIQQQQQQPPPIVQPTVDSSTIPHLAVQPTVDSGTIPHLTLMQYGLPSNSTATALPPGYLALPYSSLQDMQLRMHQPQQSMVPIPTQLQLSGGIPVVKPMMTMSDSVMGLNPAIQVVGGVPIQQAQLAQLPMAAHGGNPTFIQAPSAGCSWVAPVPVMNSCIINNPFQPGVMAAPWVK